MNKNDLTWIWFIHALKTMELKHGYATFKFTAKSNDVEKQQLIKQNIRLANVGYQPHQTSPSPFIFWLWFLMSLVSLLVAYPHPYPVHSVQKRKKINNNQVLKIPRIFSILHRCLWTTTSHLHIIFIFFQLLCFETS